jgi:hypothetical protein
MIAGLDECNHYRMNYNNLDTIFNIKLIVKIYYNKKSNIRVSSNAALS